MSHLAHSRDLAVPDSGDVEKAQRVGPFETLKTACPSQGQQGFGLSKDLPIDRSLSPIAIATRFPTIGQLENATLATSALSFSTIPALVGLDAAKGPKDSPGETDGNRSSYPESCHQVQQNVSGEYHPKTFTKLHHGVSMELRNAQYSNTSLNVEGGPIVSKARLLRPFEAFESAKMLRKQPNDGAQVRRSTSVIAPAHNLRRPYSDIFSGKGRVSWDCFTAQQPKREDSSSIHARTSSTSLPWPAPRTSPPMSLASTQTIQHSGVCQSATAIEPDSEFQPQHHTSQTSCTNLRSTDLVAQECVDNLVSLGFNIERSRLQVYASIAGGDLNEAIDMLAEDQKVHDSCKHRAGL